MHYVLAMMVAVALHLFQKSYYEKHWKDNLSAKIFYNKTHARVGDEVVLTEQVNNDKKLPIPTLCVKFSTSRSFLFDDVDNAVISDRYHRNDLFSIAGRQQITRNLKFQVTKRGYYAIEQFDLISYDLFMSVSFADKQENHTALYVYPELLADRQSLSLISSILGDITQTNMYEDLLSFRGIREYMNGDSMRCMNWKATAKTNELMVNTYFDIQSTQVVVLFNLDTNRFERNEELQEYMIRVVATLLYYMNKKDFATRLAINTRDCLTGETIITDVGKGGEHFKTLLEILSRLDLSRSKVPFEEFFYDKYALFEKNNTSVSYIIVSNYRKESLLTEFYNKRAKGYQIHFLCPEHTSFCSPIQDVQYWEVKNDEI